jgi:hypothetical protein
MHVEQINKPYGIDLAKPLFASHEHEDAALAQDMQSMRRAPVSAAAVD